MSNDKQVTLTIEAPNGDKIACHGSAMDMMTLERIVKAAAEADKHLRFIERVVVHHGTKPHISAEEALAVIQHYPPIKAITKSYVDGKVPDTPDPWAEKQPPSAGKCPSCGSDCNERDELIKAEREIDRLRERLAEREAKKQAGPVAGWKLVPELPTQDMEHAGIAMLPNAPDVAHWWIGHPRAAYRAMLAAAPPSPLTEREPAAEVSMHDVNAVMQLAGMGQLRVTPLAEQDKEDAELTDAEIDSIANEWAYEPKQMRRAGDGALVEYSCFTAPRLRHFVRAAIRAARAKKDTQK